jgi:SEC-C motif-containing protein
MRSRYTAFCRGNVDYLIATHHPTQRTPDERLSLSQTVQTTTWLGLTVLQTEQGQAGDDTGTVEFVAIYRSGSVGQLHERSRFRKQKGRWFYVDGDSLPPLTPKRHEPCWCGSGKKFKQCHGKG